MPDLEQEIEQMTIAYECLSEKASMAGISVNHYISLLLLEKVEQLIKLLREDRVGG